MKDIWLICNVLEIYKKIKYPDFQAMTCIYRFSIYAFCICHSINHIVCYYFKIVDIISNHCGNHIVTIYQPIVTFSVLLFIF